MFQMGFRDNKKWHDVKEAWSFTGKQKLTMNCTKTKVQKWFLKINYFYFLGGINSRVFFCIPHFLNFLRGYIFWQILFQQLRILWFFSHFKYQVPPSSFFLFSSNCPQLWHVDYDNLIDSSAHEICVTFC